MSRVQLALNVNDIDEAVSFYTALFGTEPAKRRPGYANFAITEPPLKLVLLENPGQGGTLNHLGVEVDRRRRGRRRAGPARRSRPGRGRRAGHHLLLRPAGQVLGHRRPRRRAVGDLHRPGRQRHLLGPGRRTALGRRPGRTRRHPGRTGHPVLRRLPGRQRVLLTLPENRHNTWVTLYQRTSSPLHTDSARGPAGRRPIALNPLGSRLRRNSYEAQHPAHHVAHRCRPRRRAAGRQHAADADQDAGRL